MRVTERFWAAWMVRQCLPWNERPEVRDDAHIQIGLLHLRERQHGLPLPGWLDRREA